MADKPQKKFFLRFLRLSCWAAAIAILWPLLPALAAGKQLLRGHVPKEAATAPRAGTLPDSTPLRLAIGLPLRNQPVLQELLAEIYDPHSPRYRQFLTLDQFTAQFGPTQGDYQAVINFARSTGLKVEATYPNRAVVDVSGTAENVRRVFHVNLNNYQRPDGSLFYAPDTEPSVDLDVPLLHVSGLDNYHRPFSKMRKANGQRPKAGTGLKGYYQGMDFRNIYAPMFPPRSMGRVKR